MDWIDMLKKVMKDKRVNIEQLKNRIEQNGHSLSRNSISNILKGKNSPKVETLMIIANALEVDTRELFPAATENDLDSTINGFIEVKDQIYKIESIKDIRKLLELVGGEEVSQESKTSSEPAGQISFYSVGQSYLTRGGARTKTVKLTKGVFKKYNVTICNKKEFNEIPNELSRDIKIWAFRAKEDAETAKIELKRQLNFKFNE